MAAPKRPLPKVPAAFKTKSVEEIGRASKLAQISAARQLFLNQVESACLTLKYIMEDVTNTPRDRISAATEILDRALGKAAQAIDVTSAGEKVDAPLRHLSTEELVQLAQILTPKVPGDSAVLIENEDE